MQTKPLSKRQLFTMKAKTLSQRVTHYYQHTQNTAFILECLVAILVRQALCREDFAQPLISLIRDLFLLKTPNATMRRFSPFFESFFDEEEWDRVVSRLFRTKKEYQALDHSVREVKAYLADSRRLGDPDPDYVFNLVSVFKDVNGKRHTWTLREVDAARSEKETVALLKVLTSLTILETSGVRQFAEYVRCKRHKTLVDMVHEEAHDGQEAAEALTDGLSQIAEPSEHSPETFQRPISYGKRNTPTKSESVSFGTAAAMAEPIDQETYDLAEAAVAAIAKGKRPSIDFRKPKSEKQKKIDEQQNLLKQRRSSSGKQGQGGSKKKPKKKQRKKHQK